MEYNQTKNLKSEILEYIESIFVDSRKKGIKKIKLTSGIIHKELGLKDRHSSVCNVMYSKMRDCDNIIESPPKGNGCRLTIEYQL